MEEPAPVEESVPPGPPSAGAPGAAGGTPPPPAGDQAPHKTTAPLPLGATGELPSFTVTVTAVLTDAAEPLEGGGSPPPVNGRYLLVDLTATYTGADAGSVGPPFLTVGLAGGDGLEYREEGCAAVVDEPAFAVAPLSTEESGSWQACIDAAPGALEGASLFVSQLGASAEDRMYFQLG